MNEISLNDLDKLSGVVLVYTNMCGTCEAAKRMLNILSKTMMNISFNQLNVNFNKEIINIYQIGSIPCFLIYRNGILIDKFYAFHSVTYLYEKFKGLFS